MIAKYLVKNLIGIQNNFRLISPIQRRSVSMTKTPLMAGHSKWANIRHIKAQKDGEKAALFTRISRQIRLSIQEHGSADPTLNGNLRSIMDEALRKNMPMASIQSTIKKCQQSKTELKRHLLEMRYKQKVFMVCTLFTDNFAMAKQELATILRKNGAIYTDAAHMFDEIGVIEAVCDNSAAKSNEILEERATEDAIECGAEDVEILDATIGAVNFFCSPRELKVVRRSVEGKGYKIDCSNHIYTPKNTVTLVEDELKAYQTFVDKLQSVSGVEDVFDNVEYADEK